jgi:hypothetical protein
MIALGLAIAAGPGFAEEAQPISVPYRLTETQHIMVRVKLNGKGPFNLIMDTGAPALFVATAASKKAGVSADSKGWGTFDRVEFEGGIVLEKVKARVEDPFQLKGMNGMGLAGHELHGMIGYTILAKYKITYDLTSEKLLFTPLKFDPPPLEPLGLGGGGQPGGLEILGNVMKFLGPLLGLKGPPEKKPRGFFGIEVGEADEGVLVKSVLAGSPADKAGLKPGDKIQRFNKHKLDLISDLTRRSSQHSANDEIILMIDRGGVEKKIVLELGKGL